MLVMNCWEFFTNIDVVTSEFPWYSEALDCSTEIGRLFSFRRIPTTQMAGRLEVALPY